MSEKTPKISHILAIDFGKSKVGLAMADDETKMAFSYGILKNDKNLEDKLKKIIKKENIKKVVVGKLDHKLGEKESDFEKFVGDLKENNHMEIYFQEEMFTSKMARERMKEAGKKNIAQDDDQAAKIILEDWIEKYINI